MYFLPPVLQYVLVYSGFSLHPDDVLFWQLPDQFKGDKVNAWIGSGLPTTEPSRLSDLP